MLVNQTDAGAEPPSGRRASRQGQRGANGVVYLTPAVDEPPDLAARLASARAELHTQTQRFHAASSQLQVIMLRLQSGRPQYDRLRESALARLQAKLDTMPVIEQAKGILMAQCRCGPDEAFDLLRRASQRTNVRVSVLATRIVKEVAEGKPLPGPRIRPPSSRRDTNIVA